MLSVLMAAVVAIAISLATVWLILGVAYVWLRPDRASLREAMRLPPDVVRLVRHLLSNDELPRGVRVRMWLLLGYLLMPIDIVPDFIPVIGYADDVIVVSILLGGAIRIAGLETIERAWSGTEAGLNVLTRLCRVA